MATDTVSMITSTRRWSIALLSIIILLAGCEKQSDQPAQDAEETAPSAPHIAPQALAQITTRTWQQGREITQTIEPALLALQRATQTLTADPSELNLTNARKQWHQAHQQLMRLQPFFTLGHINPGLFKQLEHAQWQIDAWPIEPGYIDYFDVYKHSGIVNDIALPVTADAIRQQHGFSSDSDVAIGMHAIAYLLWGEKQQRPASDFAAQAPSASEQKNGLGGADLPPRRRGALLNLLLSLILDDLRALDYKLNQTASGLNVNYHKLPAQSQLLLWQQCIEHLLRRQIIETQLAVLRNAEANEAFYQHQQFAGNGIQSITSIIVSVENLVSAEDAGGQTLAQGMNPKLDKALLHQTFIETRELLLSLNPASTPLSAEQIDAIEQHVENLAEQLSPQA